MRFSSRATSSRNVSTPRQKLSTSPGRASRGCSSVQYSARFSARRRTASRCHAAKVLPPEARRCATMSPSSLERSSSKSQLRRRKRVSTVPAKSADPSISTCFRAVSSRANRNGRAPGVSFTTSALGASAGARSRRPVSVIARRRSGKGGQRNSTPWPANALSRSAAHGCCCRRWFRAARAPRSIMEFSGRAALRPGQPTCCIPASSQPEAPFTGFRRCQISSNGSAGALASSRIEPENRTLAQCSSPSVTSSKRAAFNVTTSVCCTPKCPATSSFSVLNMSSVVTWRSRARPLGPLPRQETHQSEYDGSGKQDHEKCADRGPETSLREQPAQADARGECGEGPKPAARRRLRSRGRLLLLRRRSRLLRRRGDLALGSEAPAAAESRRLDVICHQAHSERQREQRNNQSFHGLSPRLKIYNPGAKRRCPRSG